MAYDVDGNLLALPSTSVFMKDFTNMKTTMETKMDELHKMIVQLMEAKVTASPPTPEIPPEDLVEEEDKREKWGL